MDCQCCPVETYWRNPPLCGFPPQEWGNPPIVILELLTLTNGGFPHLRLKPTMVGSPIKRGTDTPSKNKHKMVKTSKFWGQNKCSRHILAFF